MITTAIVKKDGLYITDFNAVRKLKTKTVQVDITIIEKPATKPKKKRHFNPADFRGLISITNLKEEIKRIRSGWDRF